MSEADYERRIKEALKPVMAEHEKRIAEALKPVDEVGRVRRELKEKYGVEQRRANPLPEIAPESERKLKGLLQVIGRIATVARCIFDAEVKGIDTSEEALRELKSIKEDLERFKEPTIFPEVANSYDRLLRMIEERNWKDAIYATERLAWRIVGEAPSLTEIVRDPPEVEEEEYERARERAKYVRGPTLV